MCSGYLKKKAVFPTHRLYLDRPTALDNLVENLALRVSYGSLCAREPLTENLQCFPYVDLFVESRLNINRPPPSAPAWL